MASNKSSARKFAKAVIYQISRVLPDYYPFNFALAVPYFINGNKRLPRSGAADNATINDYIFQRMIGRRWSVEEQLCVDKEQAKIYVRGLCDVKVPKTIDTFDVDQDTTTAEVLAWLSKYKSQSFIAKPTHSSGKVLFLDSGFGEDDVHELVNLSKKNWFHIAREAQYRNLGKKIIVEENISPKKPLNDYKFFCSRGTVLYCQVDVDRFSYHKRAVCSIPEFNIEPVKYLYDKVDNVDIPKNINRMIEIASVLSRGFGFVRVDLYNLEGDIYFGELTFSPEAGSGGMSNEQWAIAFARRVKDIDGSRAS